MSKTRSVAGCTLIQATPQRRYQIANESDLSVTKISHNLHEDVIDAKDTSVLSIGWRCARNCTPVGSRFLSLNSLFGIMKKHYLALAIAATFAAPAAFADVEVGPFAIYGTLNTAVEFLDVTANGAALTPSAVSQTRLADQTSKLGFKVKHDLGSGLFAFGQIESRLYLGNNGTSTYNKAEIWGSNTFSGLDSASF